MSAFKTDQSEGIPGAGTPEQAVKKILTGSATLSLPSPFAFFVLFFSIHAFPTISEPGTGYLYMASNFYLHLDLLEHRATMSAGKPVSILRVIAEKKFALPSFLPSFLVVCLDR